MLGRTIDELAALDVSVLCDSEIREMFVALRRDIDRLEAAAARFGGGARTGDSGW